MAASRGVKVYGTYALIVGTLGVSMSVGLPYLAPRLHPPVHISPAMVAINAGLGALLAASGIGAFLLKSWGRVLAMRLAVVYMMWQAVGVLAPVADPIQRASQVITVVVSLALNAGILWFFTRPAVIAQFQAR